MKWDLSNRAECSFSFRLDVDDQWHTGARHMKWCSNHKHYGRNICMQVDSYKHFNVTNFWVRIQ
jgi:hypothetical protein